jgi:hypothetical protein
MSFGWGHLTCSALLVLFLGPLISHFLAKRKSKQDREIAKHNEAVEEFKAAFTDANTNLRFRENTVALIIKQTFEGHKVAYIKFRENLSPQKKSEFDNAWSNYEQYYNSYSKDAVHSLFASATTDYESEQREIAITLIKCLLDFAKEV